MADCKVEVNGETVGTDCGDRGCGIVCERIPGGDGGEEARAAAAQDHIGACSCICTGDAEPHRCDGRDFPEPEGGEREDARPFTPSTEVAAAFQDLKLEEAAILVDSLIPYECYIPVARVGEKVQLSTYGTLGEVMEELGMRYEQHEQSSRTGT